MELPLTVAEAAAERHNREAVARHAAAALLWPYIKAAALHEAVHKTQAEARVMADALHTLFGDIAQVGVVQITEADYLHSPSMHRGHIGQWRIHIDDADPKPDAEPGSEKPELERRVPRHERAPAADSDDTQIVR